MNKKHTRLLTVVLMILMLLLTACGKATNLVQSGTTAEDKSSVQTESMSTASELKPMKLVMIFPANDPKKDLPLVQAELNKYLTEKINASVEIRPIDWSAWTDKVNMMFASQEQIDLMFTSSWWHYGEVVSKGQVLPLDDLIEKFGQGIKSVLDPDVVVGGKINNKVYAVATNKEFAASKGISMRKDLVEKYKFDLSTVKEFKDMEPLFETISKNEPGIVPLQCKNDESPVVTLLEYGVFDKLGDGPGVLIRSGSELKVVNMYETPEYMEYTKLMHKWFLAGYINKDAATLKDSPNNAIKAGKAFSHSTSLKPGFEVQDTRACGMPMVTVELTKPYMTTGDTTSAMFAIPTTSIDPERAMMFLNLMYTDPYPLNILDWGIEGKHYVKKSEKIIDYPEGINEQNMEYNLNQPWMFFNQLNIYTWASEDPQLWEKYKEFNDNADRSLALGFAFNPENVKNEIATFNNIRDTFQGVLNTGTLDPEKEIPKFVEKLKAAGLDKIIAEKQKQLDEWAAANKK